MLNAEGKRILPSSFCTPCSTFDILSKYLFIYSYLPVHFTELDLQKVKISEYCGWHGSVAFPA